MKVARSAVLLLNSVFLIATTYSADPDLAASPVNPVNGGPLTLQIAAGPQEAGSQVALFAAYPSTNPELFSWGNVDAQGQFTYFNPSIAPVNPAMGGGLGGTVLQVEAYGYNPATGEVWQSNVITLRVAEPEHYQDGIWSSGAEIQMMMTLGVGWEELYDEAQKSTKSPDLGDQNDDTDSTVLAKALVYRAIGNEPGTDYRQEVIDACIKAIGTEGGGETLALGRNLAPYVIAADLVGLPPAEEAEFKTWLADVRHEVLAGRTLITTHEDRPNNWGTHAGASRAAIAVYLGDQLELDRTAQVFKGWVGDLSAYDGFDYGSDLSWQSDPAHPVGINPAGAKIDGHSVDGVLPDDQRRGGSFTWPPPKENYVYEALQGVLVQALILYRAGYDTWNWEDRAILRAFHWLHDEADYPAKGDDKWQPWLVNWAYGTDFPAKEGAGHGKAVGWTDWTH